jgi:hypothetical protein
MSENQNQDQKEKQVVIGEPVKSGISWKRVFAGLVCGIFFYLIGNGWKGAFVGILFAIVAFLVGYFSGRFIY